MRGCWTAMRLLTGILYALRRNRIAVPGAQSAPKRYCKTSQGLWDIKGRALGWFVVAAFCAVILVAAWTLVDGFALNAQIRHDSGQNVAPVYEGWYKTADGRIHLSFGYLNRNFAEDVDIPIGPNNSFEPGAIDQGQPTHFLPRSHHGVFAVTLPDATSKVEMKWTLTIRGHTVSVPANLSSFTRSTR